MEHIVYVIIKYYDNRKYVEFEVKGVTLNEDKAITYAKSLNVSKEEDYGQAHVSPSGDIVYDGVTEGNNRIVVTKSILYT